MVPRRCSIIEITRGLTEDILTSTALQFQAGLAAAGTAAAAWALAKREAAPCICTAAASPAAAETPVAWAAQLDEWRRAQLQPGARFEDGTFPAAA